MACVYWKLWRFNLRLDILRRRALLNLYEIVEVRRDLARYTECLATYS
jgi:hypothetical protein